MEDILYNWKKLSLTKEEDAKLSLSKSKNLRSKEFVLAAKFLTKKALNMEAIGRTLKPLWRAKKDFKVHEAGDHILLFVFELKIDTERVLANEPWTFDKHVVLLKRFDGSTSARNNNRTRRNTQPSNTMRRILDGKDCEIWLTRKDSENTDPHEYGLWLRAVPYNPRKTPFIVAPSMGNGLGGVSRPSQLSNTEKYSTTVARPTRENTAWLESNEKEGADMMNVTNMETQDTGEHITLNARNNSNPISEVFDSNPNLTSFHTKHVHFETQIQEIDPAIGKFDKCGEHVDNLLAGASHVPLIIEKQLAPSLPA
ncbi:hypothetical protein SO802_006758 [Lithocarpus litseifolius]|uniref:DUF4283 domain-containing protein n=1 Tax=Lithocarpus litseifolius TaxID=425828 RepID=A0AAW2DR05_9ROSI